MPASNLCIYPPIQIDFQSPLRLEGVFNGIATLHAAMLSGDKLPKLPLGQVHVGTENCLTVDKLSSSKVFSPHFLMCHKFLPFAAEQELNGC